MNNENNSLNITYKVGDILFHKRHGLVILTKELNKTSFLGKRQLFSMELVRNTKEGISYILYEDDLSRVSLANDNNYIEELTNFFLNFEISNDASFSYNRETDMVCISDSSETIVLSRKDFHGLKELINKEFN